MPDHIYTVMAQPPDDVPFDEFTRWFDVHVGQIMELPGWVAAERFKIDFVRGSFDPPPFSYLVRYEIEGSFEAAWSELRKAVDGGRMEMAEWFSRMAVCGWSGIPDADRVEAQSGLTPA